MACCTPSAMAGADAVKPAATTATTINFTFSLTGRSMFLSLARLSPEREGGERPTQPPRDEIGERWVVPVPYKEGEPRCFSPPRVTELSRQGGLMRIRRALCVVL